MKVRLKTVRAFEEWVAVEANVEGLLTMISEGTALEKCSKALNRPYRLLHAHLQSTPELTARYEAARKARADKLWDEKIEIADGVKNAKSMPKVAAAKLRADVRGQEAAAWNRDRYSQVLKVERTEAPAADLGLLGTVVEMLRLATQKALPVPERVVSEIAPGQGLDAGSAEAVSPPAESPAPAAAKV